MNTTGRHLNLDPSSLNRLDLQHDTQLRRKPSGEKRCVSVGLSVLLRSSLPGLGVLISLGGCVSVSLPLSLSLSLFLSLSLSPSDRVTAECVPLSTRVVHTCCQ